MIDGVALLNRLNPYAVKTQGVKVCQVKRSRMKNGTQRRWIFVTFLNNDQTIPFYCCASLVVDSVAIKKSSLVLRENRIYGKVKPLLTQIGNIDKRSAVAASSSLV